MKSKKETIESILNNTTKIYLGKVGCMCGCLGSYAEDGDGAFKSRMNKIKKLIADEPENKVIIENGYYVYVEFVTDAGTTKCMAAYTD